VKDLALTPNEVACGSARRSRSRRSRLHRRRDGGSLRPQRADGTILVYSLGTLAAGLSIVL